LPAWRAIKGLVTRGRHEHFDYGSGYYVRSTAHPIVPGTGLSFDESIDALNSPDAVYDVPASDSRGVAGLDQGA
jgi:hypothetical protein